VRFSHASARRTPKVSKGLLGAWSAAFGRVLLIWVIAALSILLGPLVFAFLTGMMMARSRQTTRSIWLKASRKSVWGVLTNFASQADWRREIKHIERVERGGEVLWREHLHFGPPLTLLAVELERFHKLERKIVDSNLPFQGSWLYELSDEKSGTRVRVTESIEVSNPALRFLNRLNGSQSKSLKLLLESIARRFKDSPRIEV